MKRRTNDDLLQVAKKATLRTGYYFLPTDVTPLQLPERGTIYIAVNEDGHVVVAKPSELYDSNFKADFDIQEVLFNDDSYEEYDNDSDSGADEAVFDGEDESDESEEDADSGEGKSEETDHEEN